MEKLKDEIIASQHLAARNNEVVRVIARVIVVRQVDIVFWYENGLHYFLIIHSDFTIPANDVVHLSFYLRAGIIYRSSFACEDRINHWIVRGLEQPRVSTR